MGDRQYLDYEADFIVFSALPSSVGVDYNYALAMSYLGEFMDIFNSLFDLGSQARIKALKTELKETLETKNYFLQTPPKSSADSAASKVLELKIKFQTPQK